MKLSISLDMGRNPLPGNPFDPDAVTYFTAAGITNATEKTFWNACVVALKGISCWDKMFCLWPFLGTSALQHSFNAKDPTKYQITWNGGVTHDNMGVQGNASDGYGDTGFSYRVEGAIDEASIGVINRNPTLTDERNFAGSVSTTPLVSRVGLHNSGSSLATIGPNDVTGNGIMAGGSSNFVTFNATARSAGTVSFMSGANSANGPIASVGSVDMPVALLARAFEGFSPDNYSDAQLSFAFIGQGFDLTGLANLRDIFITFTTGIGR